MNDRFWEIINRETRFDVRQLLRWVTPIDVDGLALDLALRDLWA